MRIDVGAQLQDFALTLALGLLLGLIFHFYQLLITRLRLPQWLLYLCDLLLWVLLLGLSFWALWFINQDELRLYIVVALALGVALYFRYLAAPCRRPLRALSAGLAVLLRGLARCLRRAGLGLRRVLTRPAAELEAEEEGDE